MASVKKVAVSMTLGPKFAMEGQIRDHAIRLDQPKNAFGDDLGPTPLEFFFVSIAGCETFRDDHK